MQFTVIHAHPLFLILRKTSNNFARASSITTLESNTDHLDSSKIAITLLLKMVQWICARARHKARTKEGSNNALGRHCANRAPLRRQGATHEREQDKISILRGSQNIPPDWDSPQDMLETLEFPHQKTVCPIVTNMEHHGNSKGTGNRRKNKICQNELRQGTKHGNYNIFAVVLTQSSHLRRRWCAKRNTHMALSESVMQSRTQRPTAKRLSVVPCSEAFAKCTSKDIPPFCPSCPAISHVLVFLLSTFPRQASH